MGYVPTGRPTGRPRTWTDEQLRRAEQMLEDGVSYREVERTTKVPRTTLREKFPGMGWSLSEAGVLGHAIANNPALRRMQHQIGLLQ